MSLIHFLCVGAQKAGTSSFHDIVRQHPEICVPEIKETHFFYKNELFEKGLGFYLSTFFKHCGREKIRGEVEPDYMFFDFVPERIKTVLGSNLKFLFLLRNPVDRAYSQYLMNFSRGFETESFDKAIELEEKRIQKGGLFKKRYSYIARGLYSKQIKTYMKYFPVENMFFVIFESDFLINREKTFKKIFEFLNVSPDVEINYNIKSNPASLPRFQFLNNLLFTDNGFKKMGKLFLPKYMVRRKLWKKLYKLNRKSATFPSLSNETRICVYEKYFKKDVEELERLLGRKLDLWRV